MIDWATFSLDDWTTLERRLQAAHPGWNPEYVSGYARGMMQGAQGDLDWARFEGVRDDPKPPAIGPESQFYSTGYRAGWRFWAGKLKDRQRFDGSTCMRCKRKHDSRTRNSPFPHRNCLSVLEDGAPTWNCE